MTYHSPVKGGAQWYSPVLTSAAMVGGRVLSSATINPKTIVNHTEIVPPQPLTDSFSRRLTYLRLSITDFCNFRCEYCLPNGYQGKRPDNELSVSEIATLIRGFA